MAEVATAFVSLLPSARGFGSQVERQISPELDKAGRTGGGRLSGALGFVLKKSVIGIGAAAGAGLGTALFKGFQRLSAIDQAQAKLKGLGHSTKSVAKIMANSLDSVKGTAFGLGDAATVAAGAVASGIKPGKDLTKNLKLVADAATIAGVPLNEMGAIFNKVAATGKIQGDVLRQLGDQGIPILQLLGKELGKTPAQVAKLASQGKIDFATFSAAMQAGLGGAALESGKTFAGALANMGAAAGRLGAALLKGLFPIAKRVFGGVTSLLDRVTQHIPAATQAVKDFFDSGAGLKIKNTAFDAVITAGGAIRDAFKGAVEQVGAFREKLKGIDLSNLDKFDGKKFGEALVTAFAIAVDALGSLSKTLVGGISKVLGSVDWLALGIKVGTQAIPFALGLATGIINGISDPSVWRQIITNLPAILLATLAIAFAPSKLLGPVARILGRIPFAGPLIEAVLRGLGRLGDSVLGALGRFFGAIGKAFLEGFGRVRIPNLLPKFVNAIKLIPTRVGVFFIDLGAKFLAGGTRAGESLGRGLRKAVDAVLQFVKSIPGKIKSALGNVGSLLLSAGKNLIQGFINGIKSKFGSVKSTLGGLTKSLTSWKGPESLDKMILTRSGQLVIDGFITGLESRYDNVQSSLGDLTGSLAQSVAVPTGARFSTTAAGSASGSDPFDGPLYLTVTNWETGAVVIDKRADRRIAASDQQGAMAARFG